MTTDLTAFAGTVGGGLFNRLHNWYMIRNPIVTAGLKCAIEIFANMYTAIAIPTNGTNAINEIPNTHYYIIVEIFANMYTAIAIPTNGTNAINEIPNTHYYITV